jgi:sugar O-acyltransferase (sialic acid O-acetyltransferase NeuD family)
MKKLALLGASGHGKVVADIAQLVGWQVVEFFDDAWPKITKNSHWPVMGDSNKLFSMIDRYSGVIVSIGDCATRLQKHHQLKALGANIVSLVHPRAVVSQYAYLGTGSVVMAGVVVNADVTIGEACIINTGATIDHDCNLQDGVHISPGVHLSGNVSIESCAWVGVGSSVRQGIKIGSFAMIGAGSVVVSNIESNTIAFGNPAKPQSNIN